MTDAARGLLSTGSDMSAMQKANPLYQALKKGAPAFGAWHMLPGTHLARTLAQTGATWVCIDTEHGQLSDSHMHDSVVAISGVAGCSPIIRIPAAEPWMVKRALDAGAHGIMVPLLQTAAEAKEFVRATKFPPRGMRGFGSPFPMSSFQTEKPMGAVQYLQEANDSLVTIVQIETREALANIKEIAAVEGVDVLFVGPFDLGNNIGHPIVEAEMHEELKAAIEKVKEAAEEQNKRVGIYCTSGQQGLTYADKGFHMISVSGDVMAIQRDVSAQIEAAKGGVAHSAYNLAKGAAQRVTGPYGK